MRKLIVAWTAFNSFSLYKDHRELTEKWIKKRYEIWKRYTLPSILSQKERFIYLVICNKKSKCVIDSVFKDIICKEQRVKVVYRDEDTDKLVNYLNKKYGVIYAVRIDSDDMYSKGAFNWILKKFPADKKYAYFRKGYGYDSSSKKLCHYDCIGSGPFFIERFNSDYLIKMTHHNLIKKRGGIDIGGKNFMVVAHRFNSSTRSGSKFFGKVITGNTKKEVLARFI